jgi:hypothetical protein
VENLKIIVQIVGPRFRFDMPEIDFGLVGVGEGKRKILLFTNEGREAERKNRNSGISHYPKRKLTVFVNKCK